MSSRGAFREFLLGELAGGLFAELARALLEEEAALGLDAAHERVQDHDRAAQVDLVGVMGPAVAEVEDGGRLVLAHLARQGRDLGGRDAGLLLGPLRGVGLDEILQLGKPQHPPLHEFGVVQPLFEDHVDQGVVQGEVGARADHPVTVGLGGGDGNPRVDVGQFGAGRKRGHEAIDFFDGDGFEQVAAVEHYVPGVLVVDADLGVGEAEQRTAGRVDRALAQGVVGKVVGRADGLHEGLAHVGGEVGPLGQGDTLAAVFLDDRLELVGDGVQRLVPAGLAELARAALAGADQRGLQPLGVIEQRYPGRAPRAEAALDAGHLGVALDERHLAVLDGDLDRAAHRAHETQTVNGFFHRTLRII